MCDLSLSPSVLARKTWAMQKNIGHMKEREHARKNFHVFLSTYHPHTTHMHILIKVV
jgi:hypothetical protein